MKLISKLLVATTLLLSVITTNAQIKNATTETVKIYGNCEMCEEKIEKAGNIKKIAKVDWNQDTGMAKITFNSKITTLEEILKRISSVGYDNELFSAPNEVYENLPGCCQYVRKPINETKQ
jgi:copper chaperone CopZ